MYSLLVVLAFAAPPPETEIYFPSSIWHQRVELNAGERVTLVGHSAGAYSAAVLALDRANQGRIKKVKLMSGAYEVGPCVRLFTVGRWSKPPRPFRGMSKWDASRCSTSHLQTKIPRCLSYTMRPTTCPG